jgi:propanediol dehydratase large subunit
MNIASRKRKERESLADRVASLGIEMPSCTYCNRHGKTCIVSPESKKCAECIRTKRKCNVEGPSSSDWSAIDSMEERLERETEETAQVMATAAAKLARLQKQKKLLRTRAKDMLRRGLSSIDELEAVEAKELEQAGVQERAPTPPGALADYVWLEPLSDEQLNQLLADFPEGTAEPQPSH